MTYAALASDLQVKPDTLRMRLARAVEKGYIPATQYGKNNEVPPEVLEYLQSGAKKSDTNRIYGSDGASAAKRKPRNPRTRTEQEQTRTPAQPFGNSEQLSNMNEGTNKAQKAVAFALLCASVLIPVTNVYRVCAELTGPFDAVLFTVTLTAVAPLFVWLRLNTWWANLLTAALIGFEVFSNTSRVFSGLMYSGVTRNPTRFLGQVCDLLQSGTYWTAVVLAASFAVMVAGVQYSLIKHLKKCL